MENRVDDWIALTSSITNEVLEPGQLPFAAAELTEQARIELYEVTGEEDDEKPFLAVLVTSKPITAVRVAVDLHGDKISDEASGLGFFFHYHRGEGHLPTNLPRWHCSTAWPFELHKNQFIVKHENHVRLNRLFPEKKPWPEQNALQSALGRRGQPQIRKKRLQ